MASRLTPVDYDPFADEAPATVPVSAGAKLTPVDYDPFGDEPLGDVVPAAPKRQVGRDAEGRMLAPSSFAPDNIVPQLIADATRNATQGFPAQPKPLPFIEANLERAKAGLTDAVAGGVRGVTEAVQAPFRALEDTALGDLVAPALGATQPINEAAAVGSELAAAQRAAGSVGAINPQDLDQLAEQAMADPEGALRYLSGIGAESLPGILGAFVTRNPNAALALTGATTAGSTYGQQRAEGADIGQAQQQALVSALLEVVGSKAPLDEALGAAVPLGRRLITVPALEAGSEAGTGISQSVAGDIVAGREVDDDAALLQGALGALVGGPLGIPEALAGRGPGRAPAPSGGPAPTPAAPQAPIAPPAPAGAAAGATPAPEAGPVVRVGPDGVLDIGTVTGNPTPEPDLATELGNLIAPASPAAVPGGETPQASVPAAAPADTDLAAGLEALLADPKLAAALEAAVAAPSEAKAPAAPTGVGGSPAPAGAVSPKRATRDQLDAALAMDEDAYIAAVNPTGKRSGPEDEIAFAADDVDTPADAVAAPDLSFTDKQGRDVQVFEGPEGLYAQVDGKTVGLIESSNGETLNQVAKEFQGAGIGSGLARAQLLRDPMTPAGSFSDAGEATRRSALRQLRAERSEALGDAVPAPAAVKAPEAKASAPEVQAPEPFIPGGKLYQAGKNTQAVELPDGTWRTRIRKKGQWQPWVPRETFDPSPAFGYAAKIPPGGYIDVDGQRVRLAPKEAPRAPAPQGPKKPSTALEALAFRGLDREAWEAAGVDPAQFNKRFGIRWLFPRTGGLTPDGARELLQQEGFLPRDQEDRPAEVEDNDAIDVVLRGLNDDDTFSTDDGDALAAWQAFQQEDDQAWQEQAEAVLADLDDVDAPIAPEDMDEALAYAALAADREFNRNEARNAANSEAEAGDRQGREVGEDRPAPRGQAGLFGAPTPRETVEAARRDRDAERDGRTGTGRTDMASGAGDLFAGPRPAQTTIETGTLPDTDQATFTGEDRSGARQIDLFMTTRGQAKPAAAAPPAPLPPGLRIKSATKIQQTGEFRTGITRVETLADAAHIIAPLRKSPQEQMMILALGANGEPLAVLRHTMGDRTSSTVDRGIVFGTIAGIPGVESVVFAHNHPSGNNVPSDSDRRVDGVFAELFRGSGIGIMGSIIVQPGRKTFSSYNADLNSATYSDIKPRPRTGSVPVVERRFSRVQPIGRRDKVTDPEQAMGIVRGASATIPVGAVLLNAQMEVIGVLPLDPQQITKLRTGDKATSHAAIIAAATKANADGVIVYGAPKDKEGLLNINAAFKDSDIRPIDAMLVAPDRSVVSIARTVGNVYARGFESRSTRQAERAPLVQQDGTPQPSQVDADAEFDETVAGARRNVSALRAMVSPKARAIRQALGAAARHVEVLGSRNDLEPDVRRRLNPSARAEGVYDPVTGTVYVFADEVDTPERAVWVAFHEVAGHVGLRGAALKLAGGDRSEAGRAMVAALDRAASNPTVRMLRDTIMGQEDYPKALATEEALAELAAAVRTGNYAGIEARYTMRVPASMRAGLRGDIQRFLQAVRAFFQRVLGRDPGFTDAQVLQLLDDAWQYAQAAPAGETGRDGVRGVESRESTPFYSALARAVDQAKGAPKRGDAAAWKGWLDGAQRRGEFKQAERDWLGLDAWLDGRGTTTREDLADFIRANEVRVEEVTLGGDRTLDTEVSAELGEWLEEAGYDPDDLESAGDWREAASAIATEAADLDPNDDADEFMRLSRLADEATDHARRMAGGMVAVPTKFSQWQLPGGQNYRELLLTLPQRSRDPVDSMTRAEMAALYEREVGYDPTEDEPGMTDQELRQLVREYSAESMAENAGDTGALAAGTFRSSHFDQPNILAHVRFNERTDADGKRVLFIEEIQSDWHQQGRKRGYVPREEALPPDTAGWKAEPTRGNMGNGQINWRVTNAAGRSWTYVGAQSATPEAVIAQAAELAAQQATDENRRVKVPDAPFKGSDEWAMLAFKRMARHAVDNGFDRIAWTTGEQQNARYDLSKQVSSLIYKKNDDGTFKVTAFTAREPNRGMPLGEGSIAADRLEDFVGKDVAQRMIDGAGEKTNLGGSTTSQPPNIWTSLKGDGLKIGGDGMRGFYDKILPSAVNKWAKKFGGKVGQADVENGGLKNQRHFISQPDAGGAVLWSGVGRDTREVARFATRAEAQAELERLSGGKDYSQQHSLDITPAMREAVAGGQPLFSQRPAEPGAAPVMRTARSIIADGRVLSLIDEAKAAGLDLAAVRAAYARKDGPALVQALDDLLLALQPPPMRVTGTKNAVTDAERAAAGKDPILRDAVKTNEAAVYEAMRTVAGDPLAGPEAVARLARGGVEGISLADEAVLLVHKTDLLNKREAAAKRLADPDASEAVKDAARAAWEAAEAQIAAVDVAAVNAGREWGRFGQFRQRMMQEDFTLAALERKERARLERPLTREESAKVREMAETIAGLQAKVDKLQAWIKASGSTRTYEALAKAVTRPAKKRPTLEALRQAANDARARLAATPDVPSRRGQSGAVLSPSVLLDYAVIGAFHIADGAAKFSDWVSAMRADLGEAFDRVKEQHPAIFKAAQKQLERPVGEGASPADVVASIDPTELTARDVYRVAEAHVRAGLRGEDKVMAATHKSLEAEFEGITEREVRQLFSDYGNATFPSMEEAKVELRQLRSLVQMQESIDRILDGMAPLRSGPQRDAMTQEVRAKRVQLNELLKTLAKDARTPGQMRSYNDARVRNLQNQIEDLEKQIATGERPEPKAKVEPSAEVQALIDRRDALVRERDAVNVGQRRNEAEKAALRKKIEAVEARIRGVVPAPRDPVQGVDDQETTNLRKQLEDLRARRNAVTAEVAAQEGIGKQIAELLQRLAGKDKPARPAQKPSSAAVTELRRIRDELATQLRELERVPVDAEARYQEMRGKAIAKRIAELQQRIADGDFEPRPRIPRALNEANQKAQYELAKAKEEFARYQFEDQLRKRSPLGKAFGAVGDTFNLARAVMTSFDLSAPLRQGGFIVLGNPLRGLKGIAPMLRAFASAQAEFTAKSEIESRPNAPLYKKFGLELTGIGAGPLAQVEEAYASRWLNKLPAAIGGGLVRGSGRAYTSFLNRLRADSFDAMVASLARGKEPTEAEGKAIARYINVATGRGPIGGRERAGEVMNTVFFAPRLVASRFQLLAGMPMYGGSARTRRMIAKEYARFLTGVAVFMGLAAFALNDAEDDDDEPKISFDPRSASFGKIQSGNTFIDPLAGLAQVTTFLGRLITGETVSASGKVSPLRQWGTLTDLRRAMGEDIAAHELNPDGMLGFGESSAADVIGRFIRTKLAPVPGAIVNSLSGSNLLGEPVSPLDAAREMVTPMSFGDIAEAMEENGVPKGTALGLLVLFGMGVQTRNTENVLTATDTARADIKERLAELPVDEWEGAMADMRKEYGPVMDGVSLAYYKRDGKYGNAGEPRRTADGMPVLETERLSNPAAANRNYRALLEAEGKTPAQITADLSRTAVHHIIPDNVVRQHPLMIQARTALGYDLDQSTNLIGLAKEKTQATEMGDELGHWTDHPFYDMAVADELDQAQQTLRRRHGSIERAPKQEVLDAIRKVEDGMRKRIKAQDVPKKDGRLAGAANENREGANRV